MPFFGRKSESKRKPNLPNKSTKSSLSAKSATMPSSLTVTPNGNMGPNNLLIGGGSLGARRKSVPLKSPFPIDNGRWEPSNLENPAIKTNSRLSKTLLETLHDKDALPYFMQYMEHKDASQLIKFWLDADSFSAAAWSRIRTHSLSAVNESCLVRPVNRPACSSTNTCHSVAAERDPHLVHKRSGSNIDSDGGYGGSTAQEHDGSGSSVTPEHDVSGSDVISLVSSETGVGTSDAQREQANNDVSKLTGASDVCDRLHSGGNTPNNDLGGSQMCANSRPVDVHASSSTTWNSIMHSQGDDVTTEMCANRDNRTTPVSVDIPHQDRLTENALGEKLRKSIERDAVCIYSKYIALDCPAPIGLTDELRNESIIKICREDGQVDPHCFQACQEHYPEYLRSVYHSQHQVDVLTSGKVYLADVLYNDTAMFYFMEFMEQEHATYLLEFFLALDNFQNHLSSQSGQYDPQEAQSDAMVLYEKYFSLQATNPLGFDDKVRFQVECNICRQEGPLPECFDFTKKIAFYTLEQDYFTNFLRSELYYKYLNELINTIHNILELPHPRKKRSGSDASSHSSHSTTSEQRTSGTKNTLLAADGKVPMKKALEKIGASNLRIDLSSMNPEEPIWLRTQPSSGMSLGHVNTMGQFVSDFVPEPDDGQNQGSRFKKKKAKEKAQEDMAWQIAQMIIKDVNSLNQDSTKTQSLPDSRPRHSDQDRLGKCRDRSKVAEANHSTR